MRTLATTATALLTAGAALAQSIDLVGLDGATSWTETLSGGDSVAGFDVFQNLADANDGWLAGGIYGATTQNGATFRLVEPDARPVDPNLVDFISPIAVADTHDNRLVTFLAIPATLGKRWDPRRVNEPGTTVPFTYTRNLIDGTNAFYPPPGDGPEGYWARIVVNVPAGIDPTDIYVANALGSASDIVLASGNIAWGTRATGQNPDGPSVTDSWVIAAVPEPGTVAVVLLLGMAAVGRWRV